MNPLSALIEILGWTFVHFLWQGTAVAALLWIGLRVVMRRSLPQRRYAAAGLALVLMLGVVAVTLSREAMGHFSWVARASAGEVSMVSVGAPPRLPGDGALLVDPATRAPAGVWPAGAATASEARLPAARASASRPQQAWAWVALPQIFPWLVGLWAAGSAMLSMRLLASWRATRRLRGEAVVSDDSLWQGRFARLCERLRIGRRVDLLTSVSAAVPMALGWLKPAVLVPAALFARLPAAQLEAILAHELAHIRRHDYLVNLLQAFVETLLFYHPAVWWVSAQLRQEREHCCDDVASTLCHSPAEYARALAALEEIRGPGLMLGIAATGGSLLGRVRRLVGMRDEGVPSASWPFGVVALLILVIALPLTLRSMENPSAARPQHAQANDPVKIINQLGSAARHEQTTELLQLWRAEYKAAPSVPADAMRRLATQVREYMERYSGAPAEKMKAMVARFEADQPWRWEEAQEAIDALCDAATAPAGWLALKEQFRAFNRVKPGETWTAEKLEALPFGPAAPHGLRAAWIFDPMKESYAVGEVLKCRIIIHNNGREPVEFRTDQWHQQDRWHVTKATGEKVEVKTTRYTGLTPYQRYRLEPGQTCEVAGHGVGIGTADYAEDYSTGAIGAEIAASAGDELRCMWDVRVEPADPNEVPRMATLGTGKVTFRVTASDPDAAPKLGVARGTGKYDLAPGIKLQVTQVTSGKDGEPTQRTNTATIQWIASNGELGLSWPIELMPGLAIDRIVWQRGGTALWILHEKAVRKVDFTNAADVKEQNWKWEEAGDFGGAPAEVRAEIEKSRPAHAAESLTPTASDEAERARLRRAKAQPYAFTRAQLNDVLRFLAQDAGINFIAPLESEGDEAPLITFQSTSSPFATLEAVAQAHGVALSLDKGVWQMKRVPALEFRLVAEEAGADTEVLTGSKQPGATEGETVQVRKAAVIEAADVAQASAQRNAGTGQWGITILLTDSGAKKLSKASKENIGKRLAIVSNGAVLSAPTIRDEIGDTVEISGNFSEPEAKALAESISPARTSQTASDEVVVVVDATGAMTLNGKATDVSRLSAALEGLPNVPGAMSVIRAEAATPYKGVAQIVEICQKAGRSIRLETVEAGAEARKQPGWRPKESGSEFFGIDEALNLADYAKKGSRTAPPAAASAELPEISALRAAVAAKETEFTAIKEKYLDRHPVYVRTSSELDLLKGSLDAALAARGVAAGQPARTFEERPQPGTPAPEASPAEPPQIAALRAALAAKEVEFTGIKQRYGKLHPTYVRASSELETLNAQLAAALAAGEPVRQPSGTAGEAAKNLQANPVDRKPSAISLRVVDGAGQEPIGEFRVVAGVKSAVSPGRDIVNWQPHTVRAGQNGTLTWPLDRGYAEMALRIEADGFAPHVLKWLKQSEGPREIPVPLVKDEGTAGRVVTPEGRPAARATVAVAMVQRDAVIEGGQLRHFGQAKPAKLGDQWRWPIFVQADADGRFQIPAENDESAAVLIVHDDGVKEMSLANFKREPEVTLEPWGRLDGRVMWGSTPGGEQAVSLTIHRDLYGYPGVIAQYEKTKSAADGTFAFERVLPGLAQVSCPMAGSSNGSLTEINLPGRLIHVTVKSGATPLLIGGEGCTVKGRLTGRASWDGVTFHFHPTAPHVGLPGDNEMWKAWNEFKTGPSGPLFFRDGLAVNADGTFEVSTVLPGDYQIFFKRAGENGYLASGKFNIGAETPGTKPEAQDIGEIKARGGTN